MPHGLFKGFKNILALNVNRCELRTHNAEIFADTAPLTILSVIHNRLTQFDLFKLLVRLPELEFIEASENLITRIDQPITGSELHMENIKLRLIALSANRLSVFPSQLLQTPAQAFTLWKWN